MPSAVWHILIIQKMVRSGSTDYKYRRVVLWTPFGMPVYKTLNQIII